MEPYKRYSQVVEKAFNITNAALDVTTGDNDVCQIMVGSEGKDFLICSLQNGKVIQCPLNLFFKERSYVSFISSGKGIIHLTGFLEPGHMNDVDSKKAKVDISDDDDSTDVLLESDESDENDAEEPSEEKEAPKVLTKREKKQLNKEKAQQNGVSEKENKNKEIEPQQKIEEVNELK